MELDDEFHRLLFKMTGKLQAYEMMKGMMVHFDRVRNMALGTMKDKSLVEEHEKMEFQKAIGFVRQINSKLLSVIVYAEGVTQ